MADLRKTVERYANDVFVGGDLAAIDDLYTEDYVNHTSAPGMPPGRDGLRALLTGFRAAFPDVQCKLLDVVVEGDKVVWYAEATGTHSAELFGIPATGKRVTWRAMSVDTCRDGRIAERSELFDLHGLLQQIAPPA